MSTQPVSFRKFPSELYKRAKIEAAKQQVSVAAIFVQAVTRYLKGAK